MCRCNQSQRSPHRRMRNPAHRVSAPAIGLHVPKVGTHRPYPGRRLRGLRGRVPNHADSFLNAEERGSLPDPSIGHGRAIGLSPLRLSRRVCSGQPVPNGSYSRQVSSRVSVWALGRVLYH